jgi:hypothetical protein
VLVVEESKLEFAEVKSGMITKADRITFWGRLRRELTRDPHARARLVPILVVDPKKSDTLDKWHELPQAVAVFSASLPSQEPTGNVRTSNQLLEEALWCMCRPDCSTDGSDPPADFSAAIEALSRFELHCHEAHQLESQVIQFLDLLFPGGLTETQEMLLLGWLSKRATSTNVARRLFSTGEISWAGGRATTTSRIAQGSVQIGRTLISMANGGLLNRLKLRKLVNGPSILTAS